MPQVAKFGVCVSIIGNWSRFSSVVKLPSPTLTSNSNSTIICPAAFAKAKSQKMLIAAFARISAEFPDWRLRLLGRADGAYANECRHLAAKTGLANRIEFAGFCDNLAAEYQRCAFLAFPSGDEGFGLVIADAAAFAKPCVMVNDWIGTAVAGGGVVTKPTVEAYVDGLRRMMADAELRCRMGEVAQKFCATTYSRERILDKWESLLKDALMQVACARNAFS